jgi:hypothetical protein
MTLHELEERMSHEEFQEWYVLLTKIEPWEREEANKGK